MEMEINKKKTHAQVNKFSGQIEFSDKYIKRKKKKQWTVYFILLMTMIFIYYF